MSESQSAVPYSSGTRTLGIQGMRFMIVGAAATFVHAATVIVLMDGFGFRLASVANAVAFLAGTGVSYLGNHCWTFQAGRWSASRLLRFFAAYLAVFASGGLVMLVAADLAGAPYMLPLAAVLMLSPIATFLLSRSWVFAEN